MKVFLYALRSVFRVPGYSIIGIVSFLVFFGINIMTLSTPIADEPLSTGLLRYMDTTVILRSSVMAALLGILTPFTIYLLRQRTKAHLGASSAGLLCSGMCCLLGPFCCGGISLVLGWLAGLIPATAGYAGGIYTFLGNHEALFFYISVVLLGYALFMNSRRVTAIAN